ncbi:MAG: prepilin-type N-terminal cleavage/methylation domain-containing protein [Nitrospirae bacterium]|nr:prepilin-type N-terminal cleavage/methylation domain-containing protein [Nitrospirota bacterium]
MKGPFSSGYFCRGAGFTLLEVLVSLAVMAIALVAIFELFSLNLRNIGASDDYVAAVIKAESKMRDIIDAGDLQERSWKETTEDGYIIEAAVQDTEGKRTENLPLKLSEIRLTVKWTKGAKEKSLTLKRVTMAEKKV